MALIPFPSIPALPGVPAIPRSPNFPPILRAGLGLVQGAILRAFQIEVRWGIYDVNGKALGDPGQFRNLEALGLGSTLSTGALEYSKETRVSDFPLERGSFASYNKVEIAAAPVVTLCFSGSETTRKAFLEAVDAACKSTALYSVVTPEINYLNYSIERYNYQRRNNKGTTLLIVEITLKEVRQVSAFFAISNKGNVNAPKDAGATPQVDTGKLQSITPPTSTLNSIAKKLPALASQAGAILQGIVN